MKKYLTTTLLVLFTISVFSQEGVKNKDYYLQKSKKQKKIARIMLGGGSALVLTAFIIPQGEITGYNSAGSISGIPLQSAKYKNDGIRGALFLTGTISTLISIPIFISAGKNKRRAASLSFNNIMMQQIKNSSLVYKPIPAVSIKINL